MITKNLMNALEELNFTYVDNKNNSHAYAVYGEYLISVYEIGNKKVAYFNFKFPENEENDLKKYAISEVFSSELEQFSVTDYSLTEDGMRVFSSGTVPVFLKLIDRCVDLLSENEIRGVEYCSKCGNKFGNRNPKKVTFAKENMLMCEHCALETVESLSEKANQKAVEAQKGNAGIGILGSVVFSIIALIPYFIPYFYYLIKYSTSENIDTVSKFNLQSVLCATGFIIAAMAYLGYRVFCKKISIAAYITIAVNALLFTSLGQLLSSVFEFIGYENLSASYLTNKHFWLVHLRNTIPENAVDIVNHSEIFYKYLALSVLFAVVGVAIFLLTMHEKKNAKPETAEIETIKIN